MNVREIEESTLDERTKGFPAGVGPLRVNQIGSQGWNVLRQDLSLPLAVLKQSALDHNSHWMRRFVQATGAHLAPHGKTTMCPQLFARQLADGAWGMSFATVDQVRVARRYGVSRILLANQLVGRQAISYVLQALASDPSFKFYCLVDSLAGVDLLSQAVAAYGLSRPLTVLLEIGIEGARCGARTVEGALEVARAVRRAAPHLELAGIEGFEGSVKLGTADETAAGVRAFLHRLLNVAERCQAEQLFTERPLVLSAGGSAYFDLVLDVLSAAESRLGREVQVVLRSGCYLTHDSGFYRRVHSWLAQRSTVAASLGTGLQPALEVWSLVQSRPEPTRLVLALGKRDISYDLDLPQPQAWFSPGRHTAPQPVPEECRIVGLNDQHALVDVPGHSPLAVGDLVACGISHPCTTFDKWAWLPVVNDAYEVISAVRTFF